MSKINIQVETINFKESVIQIIEASVQEKFLLDYVTQKEIFEYIKLNINFKSYVLPKTIKNSKIINEFEELKSNFKKYLERKLSSNVNKVDIEKTVTELLHNIYLSNIKFIDEKISEITDKIERIKNGEFENKEEEYALRLFRFKKRKKEKIIDSYEKILEQELKDTIKHQRKTIENQKSKIDPETILEYESSIPISTNADNNIFNWVGNEHLWIAGALTYAFN